MRAPERCAEAARDRREHAIRIAHHVLMLEPDHPDARGRKVSGSEHVAAYRNAVVMCGAIELDGKSLGRAIEVEHEGTDAVLTAELAALELASLQVMPEQGFCGSQVRA